MLDTRVSRIYGKTYFMSCYDINKIGLHLMT